MTEVDERGDRIACVAKFSKVRSSCSRPREVAPLGRNFLVLQHVRHFRCGVNRVRLVLQMKLEGGLRAQREHCFNDVKTQMVAEAIAQEYNKRKPTCKVIRPASAL